MMSVSVLLILAIAGQQYFISKLQSQVEIISKENGELSLSLKTEQAKSADALKRYNNAVEDILALNEKNSSIQLDHQKATRELNDARTRLKKLSLQRPALVRTIINDKFNDIMQSIYKATDSSGSSKGGDSSDKGTETSTGVANKG